MDPDSVWIEELLKNNDPPSDVAAQEVKRLLLQPLKDLEDIYSEMLSLQERLLELESKREETQKQISRYQSILAPIRRVCPEVLGEIFYHCLPTDRNPSMKSSEHPLPLGRVCSTWRSTAISTPKLWARLHITFSDEDTVPDLESALEMVRNGQGHMNALWRNPPPKVDKERTMQFLRRRYEAVKEWFSRSGSMPLSISLRFTAVGWYSTPYSHRPPGVMVELLSFLASLGPRWKKVELDAPFEIYQALEDRLPVSQMTTLISFEVLDSSHYSQFKRNSGLKALGAPNLRKITLLNDYAMAWRDSHWSFARWDKLTHISCYTFWSQEDNVFILEHAANLVEYQGIIASGPIEDTPGLHNRLITLPFLRSLSITEMICPQRLYDHIDAAKLQRVKYTSEFHPESRSSDDPTPFPILSLLRKSTELKTLFIEAYYLRFWDVGTLLRAVPSVTDLVIGTEGKPSPQIHPITHRDYDASGLLKKYPWSFSDLIVDSNSDTALLPQLKSLAITSASVLTSDDTLFDMIKSRMSPSSKTASLEYVKAFLYREIERNIVEDLSAYAESVGVKINLDFIYAQKPDPTLIPTAPDFGLRDSLYLDSMYVTATAG